MSPEECRCPSEKEKTPMKEREVGVMLSAVTHNRVHGWAGAGSSTVVDRGEDWGWPVYEDTRSPVHL